jgi:amino acid adenylation domain-containing protein
MSYTQRTPALTLPDYLHAAAEIVPDRVAVVDTHGEMLTYRDLSDTVLNLARRLRESGIEKGDRVLVYMPKSILALCAVLSVIESGAICVPVDFRTPKARKDKIVNGCDPTAEISDHGLQIIDSSKRAYIKSWVELKQRIADGRMPSVELAPADLAYILYTSGSTGDPKGVCISHSNATAFTEWCISTLPVHDKEQVCSIAPFHFDLSIFDLYVTITVGGTIHLATEEMMKEPALLAHFIYQSSITCIYATPTTLSLLALYGKEYTAKCTSLRVVMYAGELFSPHALDLIRRLWPQSRLFNLYGPTETNVCTYHELLPEENIFDGVTPAVIGQACSHCTLMIIDRDGDRGGMEGNLLVSGPGITDGYWSADEHRSCRFLDLNGRRWYDTGDVVRVDPLRGYIFLGRCDRMIKRNGYRIELGDVESCLGSHPHISAVAAIASHRDRSSPSLVVFVVPRPGFNVSKAELRGFLSAELPSFMRPDRLTIVTGLPQTLNGKIDYLRLAREMQQPGLNAVDQL